MTFTDYLLSTLGLYGLPVLFGVLLIGCIGVPMPSSLLLLVSGALTEQGDMNLGLALALSVAAAIIGDNIGYAIGRWGGRHVRLSRFVGGEARLKRAEEWLKRWEGAGIFFSRWLITPLGPVINITSGLTAYSWPRFLFYDVIGEVLWVVLYILLGRFFSDRVVEMSELLGDFVWVIVGLLSVGVLGWIVAKYLRTNETRNAER